MGLILASYRGDKLHMLMYKHQEYGFIKVSTKIAMNLILKSHVSNGWMRYFGCNISTMCMKTWDVIVLWNIMLEYSHPPKGWSGQVYLGFIGIVPHIILVCGWSWAYSICCWKGLMFVPCIVFFLFAFFLFPFSFFSGRSCEDIYKYKVLIMCLCKILNWS